MPGRRRARGLDGADRARRGYLRPCVPRWFATDTTPRHCWPGSRPTPRPDATSPQSSTAGASARPAPTLRAESGIVDRRTAVSPCSFAGMVTGGSSPPSKGARVVGASWREISPRAPRRVCPVTSAGWISLPSLPLRSGLRRDRTGRTVASRGRGQSHRAATGRRTRRASAREPRRLATDAKAPADHGPSGAPATKLDHLGRSKSDPPRWVGRLWSGARRAERSSRPARQSRVGGAPRSLSRRR